MIKLNFPQKNRAEHGAGISEKETEFAFKKEKKTSVLT